VKRELRLLGDRNGGIIFGQEPQLGPAEPFDLISVGTDCHPFLDESVTGCNRVRLTPDLHHAQPAGSVWIYPFIETEMGDFCPAQPEGLQ
jgi:hypothetical protein